MFRAKLVFLFAASCLASFGSVIVVPNGNTSTVGNSTDSPDTGDFRVQQLLGSGQFASVGGSLLIDQLSFRLAPETGSGSLSATNLNLYLSTSPKLPSTISTTFADNISPDNTLVFSGPFTASSSGCTGPAVCPFDLRLNFTTPFLYNPAQGSLLLDFKFTGISQTGELDEMDFAGPNGGIVSLVALLNDTTAIASGFSTDILQLRYTAAVPEPTTGAFVFIGAASLALMRRHRSARAAR
jgi:hypothetical protein